MNQILKFDADNMYAVCQTGVITGDLQREAAKHGLLYAGDPSSADSSMIGATLPTMPAATRPSNTARRAIRFTA